MCGITGYTGTQEAVPIILDSLDRLQYRGYDSAGYATLGQDGSITLRKTIGPVDSLRSFLPADAGSFAGIGHTRWATHGRPTIENTHPFLSCDGAVAVVHNGVVENYLELRSQLEGRGHRFISETDSEVIPHLIEEEMKAGRTVREAFSRLPGTLQGSFAVAALVAGRRELYLTRRGAPLVVGVSENGYYPASDIPSFLSFTNRVVYLKDDECVVLSPDGIHQLTDGGVTSRRFEPSEIGVVDMTPESIEKGGFEHFMIKEICEQAEVLGRLIERPSPSLDELVRAMRRARKVFVVGIGTSYHSALYFDRMAHQVGLDNVRAVVSSEIDQFRGIDKDSLVVRDRYAMA